MSKSAKKWLLAAAFLVVTGVIIIAVVSAYHWEFTDLGAEKRETSTYVIREDFQSIKVDTDTADILFAVSDDDTCRAVCCAEKKIKHSVDVREGTLTIRVTDDRAWYEQIGLNFRSPKVTVYLPKTEYASIVMEAGTGDIEIPNAIKVDRADISLSTGDIRIGHMSAGTLELSSSTGEITVSDVSCRGDIRIDVTTGEVDLENVTCQNLSSGGSTGDVSLEDVIAAEKIYVERSTGNVEFEDADAAGLFVKTSTGDVVGSLRTEKVFVTETSTGDISVPKTAAGGKCEIMTSTGDIRIELSDGTKG